MGGPLNVIYWIFLVLSPIRDSWIHESAEGGGPLLAQLCMNPEITSLPLDWKAGGTVGACVLKEKHEESKDGGTTGQGETGDERKIGSCLSIHKPRYFSEERRRG